MTLKRLLEIWIRVQRLGSGVSNSMDDIFQQHSGAAKKIILNKSLSVGDKVKRVNRLVGDSHNEIRKLILDELQEVGVYVQGATVLAVSRQAERTLKPIRITKKLISESIARVGPTNTSVVTLLDSLRFRNRRGLTNIIYRAAQGGLDSREIGGLIGDAFRYNRRQAELIGRTATNATSNEVYSRLYNSNSNLVDRIRIIATLDHRTSDICVQMDGTTFKVDLAPTPPLHVGCRTVVVPIFKDETASQIDERLSFRTAVEVKSVEQLEKKGLRTRTGRTRNPNSRRDKGDSPLYRKTTRATNYESWLRNQPKAYQQSILGKAAGEDFSGGSPLSKVLGNRNSATTVKQLMRNAL